MQISITLESGLVGADRWRVGLVRRAAQKRECKQQRRERAVEENGVGVPTDDHGPTIALEYSGYKRRIQIGLTPALFFTPRADRPRRGTAKEQ